MLAIHRTRLIILTLALNLLRELEPEAHTMTSHSLLIKSNDRPSGPSSAIVGALQRLAAAVAAVHARRQRQESFRLWMLNEHALQDLGYEERDAELARLTDAGSIPLGYFGFASLLFQNRRASSPTCGAAYGSTRLRR